MTVRVRAHWIIGIISVGFLLTACTSDNSDLKRYIHGIKTRPGKPIEPIPTFKKPPHYIFPKNDTRRSPFKPLIPEQQANVFAPDSKRPKQALEAFPLDALKFVGILKEVHTTWGLIKQPDGKITRIKPGDYMGQNYGQIRSITTTQLTLEETVQGIGKWEKRTVVLELKKPEQ